MSKLYFLTIQVTHYDIMWAVVSALQMLIMMHGQKKAVQETTKVHGGTEHVKQGKRHMQTDTKILFPIR